MKRAAHILYISVGLLVVSASLATANQIVKDAEQLDKMMENKVVPNVSITVTQNDTPVAESTSHSAAKQDPITIDTVNYIGLNSEASQSKLYASFNGTDTIPNTIMTVRFAADNIVRSTEVNSDGQWQIEVPLDTMMYPSQSVYLLARQEKMVSKEYLISQFTIHRSDSLSQDTWMFIFSALIAIITLLVAVTVQVRHNMKPQPGMLY